jgi:hypothetical protein
VVFAAVIYSTTVLAGKSVVAQKKIAALGTFTERSRQIAQGSDLFSTKI